MDNLKSLLDGYVKAEGITKEELANRLNISRGTLFYRLNGSMWRLDEAAKLSELLGVPLTELARLVCK